MGEFRDRGTPANGTPMTTDAQAGAILAVNLDAVAANWRLLRDRLGGTECGAVVKADGYGLGMAPVARALAAAGCRSYFVAHAEEGITLRGVLPDAAIYVMHGVAPGEEAELAAHALIPALNTLDEVARLAAFGRRRGLPVPAALHIDTGMSRLGLEHTDVDSLAADPAALDGLTLRCVMSHLVAAEEARNPLAARQLAAFNALRARLPAARASIANSAAVFLGPEYRLDLARPGAAIYGLAPLESVPNQMAQVIELKGRILQVRSIDSPRTVGYGATHRVAVRSRVATVAVGYADGYLRSLSSRGSAFIAGVRVPVVGRVSMDLITLDVTGVPDALVHAGAHVELIGPHHSPDDLAREAGTIGYEILTGLGRRYRRVYTGGGA
jgi:alanine racemase